MSNSQEVVIIPKGEEINVWNDVAPLLQKALEYTDKLDIVDILAALDNKWRLWVVHEKTIRVAWVTEIIDYPQKRVLQIPLLGGEEGILDQWLDLVNEAMEKFARWHNCKSIVVMGRFGWERKLKRLDYKKEFVSLEREL